MNLQKTDEYQNILDSLEFETTDQNCKKVLELVKEYLENSLIIKNKKDEIESHKDSYEKKINEKELDIGEAIIYKTHLDKINNDVDEIKKNHIDVIQQLKELIPENIIIKLPPKTSTSFKKYMSINNNNISFEEEKW